MKVGELVRLSARAKKLQRNDWFPLLDPVGIVVGIDTWYSIKVEWVGFNRPLWCIDTYTRQDLKYAK